MRGFSGEERGASTTPISLGAVRLGPSFSPFFSGTPSHGFVPLRWGLNLVAAQKPPKMPESRFDGPATLLATSALLCSVLTQCQTPRRSELCSEVLAWTLLPFFPNFMRWLRGLLTKAATTTEPFDGVARNHVPPRLLWIIAACIAVSAVYRADNNLAASLSALLPLALIHDIHSAPGDGLPKVLSHRLFPNVNTTLGPTLVTFFGVAALSGWELRTLVLSSLPAVVFLGVYAALFHRDIKSGRLQPLAGLESFLVPLASRVVAFLAVFFLFRLAVFPCPAAFSVSTLSSAIGKASSWYLTIRTTHFAPWSLICLIATFVITSTRSPIVQPSETLALSHLAASLLSLGQITHVLPKQAKDRSVLWLFSLVPLIPYVFNVFAIRTAHFSTPIFTPPQEHPVEALIHRAKSDFEHKLQRQSKTYAAAVDEYQRRYRVEPPPGFEAWYQFATAHQSPIIDDFDVIYDTVSPFWSLSGGEVLRVMNNAYNTPNSELWSCSFSGAAAQTYCAHPYRTFDRHMGLLFERLLGSIPGAIPDVRFLVNHFDEPRILIPPLEGGSQARDGLKITDMSHQPVWDALTESCTPRRNKTGGSSQEAVKTFGLPFVANLSSAMDLCQHPEYSTMHGMFISPVSFRPIEGVVPVLSTGAPSTMADVLIPSPAYIESEFQYDEAHDVEWDAKRNNLFWAGSTTGGFAQDDQWRHFHRQRFVELAQNPGEGEERQEQGQGRGRRPYYYYLRADKDGAISPTASSFLNGRLFDVAFTKIFQCEKSSCGEQAAHFNVKSWSHKDQALRSRLVFDTDGNGISGRYYKLLASRSTPLKQTLLREWHQDRLVPWVHYVPVSQGMEEVPELVFYLTSTEDGQRRAREIAEQGRSWFQVAFREVDLSIYTYRLLLELARLQDPQRQAWGAHQTH